MRLITHNMLKCNIKGLEPEQGYPLAIECEKQEVIPQEYHPGPAAAPYYLRLVSC
jgi:hypothetical protein